MKELRTIGIVGTVAIWSAVGVILFLQTGKSLYLGETPDTMVLVLLGLSVLTVAGTLMGDKPRRVVGTIWTIIAVIGFLGFIGGAGLSIESMLDKSIAMMFAGLITVRLIFLPDQED